MERLTLGTWQLRHDPQASRRLYEAIAQGYPERCSCLHCRNYVAARDRVYGGRVGELLETLGIIPAREAEVYWQGPSGPGRHAYGGWFHFAGAIEQPADPFTTPDLGLDTFARFWFSSSGPLLPEPFQGVETVSLEFEAVVPWVLPDAPE